MFHLVLFEPEIPPNTGNIMRLCVNTGVKLYLIKPLGFNLDDKQLRRAGLDYRELANVRVFDSFEAFIEHIRPHRLLAFTTKGTTQLADVEFSREDTLIFGPETRGLPQQLLDSLPPQHCVRIPMRPESRSLNLSNAAAIVCYEAWRQLGYEGAEDK